MDSEVLIVIITVVGNILITLIGILANIHITKISNIDKLHEFKRHLTAYEIAARPAEWILTTAEDEEAFNRYDRPTRKWILRRYKKLKGTIKNLEDIALKEASILAMASQGPVIKGMPENTTIEIDDDK